MTAFGPGTLQFGEVGSEIDASCAVNSCTITPSKEQGDSKTMLCGTVKAGATTYTYVIGGNLDTDVEDPEGLFAFCDANAGAEVPFTYTPNTEAGTTATGIVVLDPLAFGGEEYGAEMASDFEFAIVGKPDYSYPEEPTPPAVAAKRAKGRVVDGLPPAGVKANPDGSYTPYTPPAKRSSSSSTSTSSSSKPAPAGASA